MMRFIAGILATLLVQAIGWSRIESAARTLRAHTQAVYQAAEHELRSEERRP